MSEKIEFKNLQANTLVDELVKFIENELPNFPASSEFLDILEQKKNENQHSLSFCAFMTNKCKSKFYFARENAQKGSSVVDMGIYQGSNLIFTIEAKLLPIPMGTKKAPRFEHEYVYGKGAGIQRFKDEKHGLDNSNNLLNESALIAFVKENDFGFWHQKIDQWIIDAKWGDLEKLEKIHFNSIAKLKSKHTRISNSEMILYHFWITLS